MNNADVFKQMFGIYATELWAMGEKDFLKWLNSEHEPQRKKGKWINIREGNRADCDQCGQSGRAWMNFCFLCGADMRESENDEMA